MGNPTCPGIHNKGNDFAKCTNNLFISTPDIISLNEECRTAELKLFNKKPSVSAIKEINLKTVYLVQFLVERNVVNRIRFFNNPS